MEKTKTLTTPGQIKAFSDPYKLQIIFNYKRSDRPATVKEIADKMGETPAKVHYHVKKLLEAGILELSHTKEIKGIIAKYYELTAEKFALKYDDNNSQISQLIKTEIQRAISSIYDESKKIVLNGIDKLENNLIDDDNTDDMQDIMLSTVYLSNDDVNELKRFIKEISEKNMRNDKNQDLKEFHFFTVLFPLESDSDSEAGE